MYEYFYKKYISKATVSNGQLSGLCCFHDDLNPSFSANINNGLWKCHGCNLSGNAFKFAKLVKVPFSSVPGYSKQEEKRHSMTMIEKYDYKDENGNLLYQVCRYMPKSFRMRQRNENGEWLWNLRNARRVLYRLPEVLRSSTVYIAEGEKDCNSLAALGYCATCNPGGAGKWQDDFSDYLVNKQIVLIPDNDDPGREHMLKVGQSLQNKAQNVKVLLLPEEKGVKDATDYINRHGPEGFRKILSTSIDFKDFATAKKGSDSMSLELQSELNGIIQNANLTWANKSREIATATIKALNNSGRLFYNQEAIDFKHTYYFENRSKRLINLKSDEFCAMLAKTTGQNRTERTFKFIFEAIQDSALDAAYSTAFIPRDFWTFSDDAIYISNGPGRLCKITADKYEMADNGQDAVLFTPKNTLREWAFAEPLDPFENLLLFRNLNTTENGKLLLKLYLLSMFSNQRTRPLLCLTGDIGSGKTRTAVGLFEILGMCPRIIIPGEKSEDDIWAAMNIGGLLCLDNVDTNIRWLPDLLAAAATDGQREKRRLYTDGDIYQQSIKCWSLITSADPRFAADPAVSDRILIVRFQRSVRDTLESELSEDIIAKRNGILTWICQTLSRTLTIDERIVGGALNSRHPDWASFAIKCGRVLGIESESIECLKLAEIEKSNFNIENDPVGNAIAELVNREKEFTGSCQELLSKLKEVDPIFGNEQMWNSYKLSKRLSKMQVHLNQLFTFRIEENSHTKCKTYLFRLR